MAGITASLYRNYTSSDETRYGPYNTTITFPSPSDIGWDAPSGMSFKEWNDIRNGTGNAYNVGDSTSFSSPTQFFAIWQESINPIDYLTTDQEITSIANAIRAKSGTSESLVYPAGFVSAIEAISTGGVVVSDTTDTHGGTIRTITTTQTPVMLQAKTGITPGASAVTVTPDNGYNGMSSVQVNGDANLVAANIKNGTTIFGVQGTYSGGGGIQEVSPNEVNFFDYDGRILYSYSATEFASLSEMPKNPEREGFTSEGWNWSLSDAKSYVAKNVFLQIGQMYKATGSELKVYVRIWNGADKSITLQIPAGSNRVIDWGDNQTEEISGSTLVDKSHTYATHGLYVVKISNVTSLGSSSNGSVGAYCPQSIEAIVFPFLPGYFDDLIFLNDICIPPNTGTAVSYAFSYLKKMNHITIPSNVKSSSFYASKYKSISFASTDTVTSAPTCRDCASLSHISLPNSITSIPANGFNSCSSLTYITIPENVTSIGSSAFGSCGYLQVIRVKPTNPPTIQSNTFSDLPSNCKIIVPSASLATYKSASNWSTHASKMVGE